jgi:hypothetical protein
MKQRNLLFTLATGFSCLVFSSYINGPGAHSLNQTGSAGSIATCSGSGCHAPNNTNTTVEVRLTDTAADLTPITTYIPGKTYKIRVMGSNATLSRFGFQASVVKASNTSAQAGTLAVGSASYSIHSIGSLQFFEHNQVLIASFSSSGSYTPFVSCYWTAPPAGTGTVKIYAIINSVNNDGTPNGDEPNAAVVTINDPASNIAATTNSLELNVYPNPATALVFVNAEGIGNGSCTVNVYDMRGKLLSAEATDAVNGSLNTTINTSKWAAGLYFVQVAKDNQQKVIAVEKQ